MATFHDVTLDYLPIRKALHPEEHLPAFTLEDEHELTWVPDFSEGLAYLTPDAFGYLSDDGLKFFELCHRSEPLMAAIAQLNECYEPCCLTHQDLKLNNVLLYTDWPNQITNTDLNREFNKSESQTSAKSDFYTSKFTLQNSKRDNQQSLEEPSLLRIIDWEKAEWGDPAFDLGSLVGSYLKLWLGSLVVSGLEIETALRLATVPLEQIQPSLVALARAYAKRAPDVVERYPDFWRRVMQFAGYTLIRALRVKIKQHELLGNVGLCTLQVAKSLLCSPDQAIAIVFGMTADALMADLSILDAANLGSLSTLEPVAEPAPPAMPPFADINDLNDLIQHLHIQPDGAVYYTQNWIEASFDRVPAAQHLPDPLQQTYLRLQVRNSLYDLYFSGEKMRPMTRVDENNTRRGVDVELFERLTSANVGQGYFEEGWTVVQDHPEGRLLERQGLNLLVSEDGGTIPSSDATLGKTIAVRMPPYRMDDGFYIAIGDRGLLDATHLTVQIFFNLVPEGAIALMQHFTQTLNAAQIAFSFSVLYDPAEYGRRDAGILRIYASDFLAVRPLLQRGYERVRSQLQPAIPLFTKRLAPGIGLAEEPINSSIDFGLHRCQLLAEALLSTQSVRSPEHRLAQIRQQFDQAGVKFDRPYLNPNHGDRYAPLEEIQA